MTGNWARRQDIFTGTFDKVILSVFSKEDAHIQAPLCASVKLIWEWRFHFPRRRPQPLVFFSPGHCWAHPVLFCLTKHCCWQFAVVMLLQWGGALPKPTLKRTLNDQVLHRPEREECQNRDWFSTPRSSSMGTRARTKKTVSFSKNLSFLQGSVSFSKPIRAYSVQYRICKLCCCSQLIW